MPQENADCKDRAGRKYWDDSWGTAEIPGAVDPRKSGLNNYVDRSFHKYFQGVFNGMKTSGMKILEVGCARSAWLPYFDREFHFQVYGIDYSETGCRQARDILVKEGVKGEIVCADFFTPPRSMLDAFDVVVSFGVAEHFEDTKKCIAAFSRFLKPGGVMFTSIPNMPGVVGLITKILNRPVYDVHVPLSLEDLRAAHEDNGLAVSACGYFLFLALGVANVDNLKSAFYFDVLVHLRSWVSKSVWVAEKFLPILRPNRWTSPYINCVAIKR